MQNILIIIAVNLFVFFRTLRYSLCVDDIRQYKRIQDGNLDGKFLDSPIEWISRRFYGGGTLGRAKPGDAPDAHADHLVTILLHTLASVLVYVAFGQSQVSFWAAVLYALNPTNTQTSVWLNGRRYLVNVILILTMLIISNYKYGWLACLPLYAATGLFHVTAIFSPILFIGWVSIPIMAAFYLIFKKQIDLKLKIRYESILSDDLRKINKNRIIVIIKCFGFHFFKMISPGKNLMNYPELFYWGVNQRGNKDAYAINFDFYRGCAAFLISAVCLVAVPESYRPYVIFMVLATLQWCAIIPAQQLLADRYTSAAIPFMMFLLAYFIQSPLILACIAGFYLARLWSTMEMYESIWQYYRYQMYHAPHITTPRKDLINYLINVQDYMKAWHYTREGLEYDPNDFSMLHRAAICARAVGSRKQALEYLIKAEQHLYIGQEETQKQWCQDFKDQLKREDLAQLNNKRYGG